MWCDVFSVTPVFSDIFMVPALFFFFFKECAVCIETFVSAEVWGVHMENLYCTASRGETLVLCYVFADR